MSLFDRLRRPPHGLGMTSQRARDRLVERLRAEGIADARVLEAIRATPRHLYIDESIESRAYEDTALPIGSGQTISQPYVVARMTAAILEQDVPRKVLEIGTGSGYQAAVLARLVEQVFTIERIQALLLKARACFRRDGLGNIRSRHDDGHKGWPEEAPFDAILVTAAGSAVPPALIAQLAVGGVLVGPFGSPGVQQLVRIRRTSVDATEREVLDDVVFVPLLGGLA